MTDTALPLALTLSSGVERMFPTLTPAQIKRIAAHGKLRAIRAGEVLVEAGAHVGRSSCRSSSSRQAGSRLSGHPVAPRRSSRSMDRVSLPARSTCFQAAPRSSDRAPVSRAK